MIRRLVQSAFQTGCLSVESEGLIRQVLATGYYLATDLDHLETLHQALNQGNVQRESQWHTSLLPSKPPVNLSRQVVHHVIE
jgi:hypothetical protein